MGMIEAESAVFPYGTAGNEVDILVRMHIWAAGQDFNHGTGHGIGQFMCVHECKYSVVWQPNKLPTELV